MIDSLTILNTDQNTNYNLLNSALDIKKVKTWIE